VPASKPVTSELLNLGTALLQSSRAPEGRALLERARATYEELGDRHFTARTLRQLGYASLVMGQPAAAAVQIRRGMEMAADLGDGWSIAGRPGGGGHHVQRERSAHCGSARRCGGAAAGADLYAAPPPDASINRAYLDLARERLTAGAFDRRVAQGPRDGAGVWGGSCPRSLPLG
jgi:hypothetical protein